MKKEIKKNMQFNDFLHDLFFATHEQAQIATKERTLTGEKTLAKVVRKKMHSNIYGTPLKKTLHWLLPEDQHLYFKQHEFSRIYEEMRENIITDVEHYDKKWENFQKKNSLKSRRSRKENFIFSLKNDYVDLKNSFATAPIFVRETMVVLFSIYFFLLLAASFPVATNKYISYFFTENKAASSQVANVMKREKSTDTDVYAKKISNLSAYFSEYIKKNSDSLRRAGDTEVMVKQADILGRIAGEEEVSE